MNDKITESLQEGLFGKAKELITEYESKIKEEKNEFTRCRAIEKLNYYKKVYSQYFNFEFEKIQERENKTETLRNDQPNTLKLEISANNVNYATKDFIRFPMEGEVRYLETKIYNDVHIHNSRNIAIGYINCNQSVSINKVYESTIVCTAKQIRLVESENVCVYAKATAGITLLKCKGIKIVPIDGSLKVSDFTNPLSNSNFTIVEEEGLQQLVDMGLAGLKL